MKVNYTHACPEWDYAIIGPKDVEFQACLCTCDQNKLDADTPAEE